MNKLKCSKCNNTKFIEGTSLVYTSYPPIHAQQYICENCGNLEEVRTQPIKTVPEFGQDVIINDNQYVTCNEQSDYKWDNDNLTFTETLPPKEEK